MNHVVLLLYLLCFTAGIIAITMMGTNYLKSRVEIIKNALLADIFFACILLIDSINYYGELLGRDFPAWFYGVLVYGLFGLVAVKTYYLMMIACNLAGKLFTKRHKIIFRSLVVVIYGALIGVHLLYQYGMLEPEITLSIGFSISNVAAVFGSLFCVMRVFLANKNRISELKPIVRICMAILVIIEPIALLFNFLGYMISFQYPIAFSPILYLLMNGVGIVYILKDFFSEKQGLPEKEVEKAEPFDYDMLAQRFDISQREMEILKLVLDGYNNQEVGEELHISPNTVRNHIYSIYKKAGVKNRLELASIISQNSKKNKLISNKRISEKTSSHSG
ncbi:MAG: helix-turn-helix transcriptional regulator [Clostridia bacterium]|nr:helix-turn-helix transcriptional regulator [Clostridia bacterium]